VILHLVTDRCRLAPGAGADDAVRCLVAQARAAAAAGIEVIQIRERDLEAGALARLVSAVQAAARQSHTRIIVNDRLDVALACGADGVHLRGDSFDAVHVRACAPPGFLVGRSVRSAAEARTAGPVDYVIAGTVWPTPSKETGHPLLGLDGLATICAASQAPVLAIGGVEVGRVGAIASAGAAGAAGIGMFMADERVLCRAVPLDTVVGRLRRAFDSAGPRS
jgi:thiamine-phosphate pyrophosphorylase